jgi:hypothetical protein
LTQETKEFVSWLERELEAETSFIGTGPSDYELIDRLEKQEYEQKRARERRIVALPLS